MKSLSRAFARGARPVSLLCDARIKAREIVSLESEKGISFPLPPFRIAERVAFARDEREKKQPITPCAPWISASNFAQYYLPDGVDIIPRGVVA